MKTITLPAKPSVQYFCSAYRNHERLTHCCAATSHEVARRIALTIWGIDPDKTKLSVATEVVR